MIAVRKTLHNHHLISAPKKWVKENILNSGKCFTPKYIPISVIAKPIKPMRTKTAKDVVDLDFFLSDTSLNTKVIDNIQLTASPSEKPAAVDTTTDMVDPTTVGGNSTA